jgi:hypothetical protein
MYELDPCNLLKGGQENVKELAVPRPGPMLVLIIPYYNFSPAKLGFYMFPLIIKHLRPLEWVYSE